MFDKAGDLVVADFNNDAIKVFAPGKKTPSRQFKLSSSPYALTFSKNEKQLFTTTGSQQVAIFNYVDGKMGKTISGFGISEGLAFAPPAAP